MFSLRRPNIMPVGELLRYFLICEILMSACFSAGDLGVQKGMLRWYLARHSPAHPFMISPEKDHKEEKDDTAGDVEESQDVLPSQVQRDIDNASPDNKEAMRPPRIEDAPDASSILPAPASSVLPDPPSTPPRKGRGKARPEQAAIQETPGPGLNAIPPPFTPSIKKTLADTSGPPPPPLPNGMTVAVLKTRLTGKNKIRLVHPPSMWVICA